MQLVRSLTFLFFITLLLSCNQQSDQSSADAEKQPQVALIMKSLANEFFTNMSIGAKNHQKENPNRYELIVNGIQNETDLSHQVALVEQMVAAEVDAIVIAPADSKALVPVLARANEKGIVVVNIDNKLDDIVMKEYEPQIPFIGPDNKLGASVVGEYLAKKLVTGDQVAVLEGITSSNNSQARKAGFIEAAKNHGLIIQTFQSAFWEQRKAAEITSAILIKHPDLKGVMAANDSMALGAASAIKQAGKTGEILVVGFDNISAVQTLIKSGDILATADQHADLLAVYGIGFALDILAGKAVLERRETPIDLITQEVLETL